jgi:hypothetical protein
MKCLHQHYYHLYGACLREISSEAKFLSRAGFGKSFITVTIGDGVVGAQFEIKYTKTLAKIEEVSENSK